MSNHTFQRPASRYGTPQSARRGGVSGKIMAVVIILAVLVTVIFVARTVAQREDNPVDISLVTFERQDDDMMRLWVDITRQDVDEPSYCIVTALNYAMAEVGRREVIMVPGGDKITRMEVDVPTRDYPVSGGVYGCATGVAPYIDIDEPVNTL